MTNRAKQYWILTIAGIFLMSAILQFRYRYHLSFLEQLQLFVSTKEYARQLLSLPGGLTEYMSQYLIQFFKIKFVGNLFVVALLSTIAICIHKLIAHKDKASFVFESMIVFFLFVNFLDINFYLKGITGYLFCLLVLLLYDLYERIQPRSFKKRFLFILLLGSFLFWITAPFQTLFFISASAMELKRHGLNKGKSLFPLFIITMAAIGIYFIAGESSFRMYIDIDGVCSLRIIPGWTKYAPWALLPLAILFNPLLERALQLIKKNFIKTTLQILFLGGIILYLLPKYDDNWSLPFKQLHYYATQDKWDKILDYCQKHPLINNYNCLNYQNLALAQKGILADSLLYYPQKGKYGLYAPWDRVVPTAFALQKICYHYGDIAFAQKYAFEGNVNSVTRGFPETLKMLVKTNLLQGQKKVAARYIYYLQQTVFYKEWADKQSLYLSDSSAMKNDPEYQGKERFREKENHFTYSNELYILAGLDKTDKKLRDFVLCSLLLDKDLQGFLNWFNFYHKDAGFQTISVLYYQALMACAPSVPEVLTRYPIPEKIRKDFESYTKLYSSGRNPAEKQKWLYPQYKNSYWYYFHFTKIEHE
ncbi:DUF6057 family protein [Parabacteroides pacaensis]|uniref:DUF6057 family protein n=1 Tax=Parabacteroides pacaensis TaxID=2086575 RepID=UPI000D102816|nr:DUF6057 family protein [Parabacteroides pacaensis]